MKKILSLLTVCALGIAIVFSLTACSEKTPTSSENDVTTPAETFLKHIQQNLFDIS